MVQWLCQTHQQTSELACKAEKYISTLSCGTNRSVTGDLQPWVTSPSSTSGRTTAGRKRATALAKFFSSYWDLYRLHCSCPFYSKHSLARKTWGKQAESGAWTCTRHCGSTFTQVMAPAAKSSSDFPSTYSALGLYWSCIFKVLQNHLDFLDRFRGFGHKNSYSHPDNIKQESSLNYFHNSPGISAVTSV